MSHTIQVKRLTVMLGMLLYAQVMAAQSNIDVGKLKNILNTFRTWDSYGYDYMIKMDYPDGSSEKVAGEMFADNKGKLMYNSSSIHLMFITPDWFYRANHSEQTVTIINLKNNLSEQAGERRDDIFNGYISNYFIDSVVLRYGRLKGYVENKDTVAVKLSFAINSSMKGLEVKYDLKNQMPLFVKVTAFYPSQHYGSKAGEGIWQTIVCTNYSTLRNREQFNPDAYFTTRGKAVQLKKYNNYKTFSYL